MMLATRHSRRGSLVVKFRNGDRELSEGLIARKLNGFATAQRLVAFWMMTPRVPWRQTARIAFCVVLWMLSAHSAANAQETEPPAITAPTTTAPATAASDDKVTPEALQTARTAVEQNLQLDETVRTKIVELYNTALKRLQEEATYKAELEKLKRLVDAAPTDLQRIRQELESPTPEIEKPAADADLPAIQQRLTILNEALRQGELNKTNLDKEVERRAKRRTEVPAELDTARMDLAAVQQQIAAPPTEGELAEMTLAKQRSLKAREKSLISRIALLDRELPAYDATSALLAAERDLAARQAANSRRSVTAWQEFANKQRRTEAENNVQEALDIRNKVREEARVAADDLHALAERLVSVRRELSEKIADISAEIERVEAQTERLKQEFAQITERADAAGFTNAVGVLLRKQRSSLPDLPMMRSRLGKRVQELSDVHIQRIEFQNERSEVSDVESLVDTYVEEANPRLDEEQRRALGDDFRRILQAKGRYLDGVLQDLSSYLDRLATLDTRQRTLITQTESQADYIAEYILFVRSATVVDQSTLRDAAQSAVWVGNEASVVARGLLDDVSQNFAFWLTAVGAFVLLMFSQRRMRHRIQEEGELAAKRVTTMMRPTMHALVLTLAVAFIWPAFLWLLGWRLLSFERPTPGSYAAGIGLRGTAVLLFTLDVFRHMCRPSGLGRAHFAWPGRIVETMRSSLRLVVFTVVPLVFIVLTMENTPGDLHRTSLGRLSLLTGLLITAYAIHRVLRPGGRVMDEAKARNARSWFVRTRYVWHGFGVGLPLILCGLAIAGYLYTSRQLAMRMVATGWLLLSVVTVASLLRRWQLMTYRGLAMKRARERRAAMQQESEQTTVVDSEDRGVVVEAEPDTLTDSNLQLAKLLSIVFLAVTILGLIGIWNDVLPAFGFLRNVELWERGSASDVTDGLETEDWVTLADVLLALGVIVVTLFATRNLPGFLEFAVLRRLPFDAGARYATSTVCRYAITVIGLVLAFRVIGLGWSNVQWLVGAMLVGLGFGLQEIFANFVSGLILLFERPIRVGDTVTVGDITGTVTRIRIRATTIVDWDRKELVVPNREFVTGQLVNWTLSDAVLRIVMRVGIAYGSDTDLATVLLYKIAANEPNVLEDPAPRVVFTAFGESTLDFELRCFVATPNIYRTISHDLNMAIDRSFRKHKIEIAFPQRDLHVRSIQAPLPIESAGQNGAAARIHDMAESSPV